VSITFHKWMSLVTAGLCYVGMVSIYTSWIWRGSDSASHSKVTQEVNTLFDASQITLLTLIIALAVYTSSITVKIRETMAKLPDEHRTPHLKDLYWARAADFILVVTGVIIVTRIGYRYGVEAADPVVLAQWAHIIIGALMAIVLYFAFLHGQQWCSGNRTSGSPPDHNLDIGKVLAILDVQLANDMLTKDHYDDLKLTLDGAKTGTTDTGKIKARLKTAHEVAQKL
jgi:hypothetical protein